MDKKNIRELLENHNLVVPEIQREYVWGATKNKKVLEQFLKDLDLKLKNGEANIGFLYSYNSGSENYLIDGQQRFTTMLLLLFYLSVCTGKDNYVEFVNILRLNDKLQAFSYRVRSYTESFLNNLLSHKTINTKEVRDQVWFKSEYLGDPTIDAMLGALDVFADTIPSCENISYSCIMGKVFFWYFDVEQTSQGEELYITMNSRGEKLTDSEQIKPRLLRNETIQSQKNYYGKKWDDWEEFFYEKSLRGNRGIEAIDRAMNNVIRIVLELKDIHEHDHIKPIEDCTLITLKDIETHMDAIQELVNIQGGRYVEEVTKLYGDSKVDGNFYVLKALITTHLRKPSDMREYERVYQTISNHVRRNKLRNRDFLSFLYGYKMSTADCRFYSVAKTQVDGWKFVEGSTLESNNSIFTGHELEKIELCMTLGEDAENVIWEEQAKPFWNGDIKQLISWAKVDGVFDLNKFNRIRKVFNLLFDRKSSDGWTCDDIRQAFLTKHLPKYPLVKGNYTYFGYSNAEWKEIFAAQSNDVLKFIEELENKNILNEILTLKESYPEIAENKWAEFVHHNYLLQYCDTKHLYWDENYGHQLVKSVYAKPISVRNMHIYQYLKTNWDSICINKEYTLGIWINWNSCVYIENKANNIVLDIRFLRNNNNPRYLLYYFKRNQPEETEIQLKDISNELGFIFSGERYTLEINDHEIDLLREIIRKITNS